MWVIDRAAVVALGQRWLPKCPEPKCQHWVDAEVYLVVYQIITMLLAMGYLVDASLGAFVDYHPLTGAGVTVAHPLRLAGIVAEPGFVPDWFELGPTCRSGRPVAWIHRGSGDLLLRHQKRSVSYNKWCGGSVEKGLEFLCRQIDT
ncbi:MAG: hypothetical protein D9V47_10335 [Clostridia bacterium]|nr:MAG: hypothetical protein D9V47_10335 [Clostridia bacterium]